MQQKTTLHNLWAKLVSIILHPVFLPALTYTYLMFFCPELFYDQPNPDSAKKWWLVIIAYITITFPLLTSFLLWRLKFIDSMQMHGRTERYVPLMASMLFYFWVFWTFHKQFNAHIAIQTFLFGLFLNAVFTFMATIFYKISMHATAWGGIVAFSIFLALNGISNSVFLVVLSMLLAGITGAARLYLKQHSSKELYTGYILGILSQIMAAITIHLFIN